MLNINIRWLIVNPLHRTELIHCECPGTRDCSWRVSSSMTLPFATTLSAILVHHSCGNVVHVLVSGFWSALHSTPKETHTHTHIWAADTPTVAAYQQFIHTSLTFFQVDALDGHLFLPGLAERCLHNSSGTAPCGDESRKPSVLLGTSTWCLRMTPSCKRTVLERITLASQPNHRAVFQLVASLAV